MTKKAKIIEFVETVDRPFDYGDLQRFARCSSTHIRRTIYLEWPGLTGIYVSGRKGKQKMLFFPISWHADQIEGYLGARYEWA